MAYMDEHGGRDSDKTRDANHPYETEEEREIREKREREERQAAEKTVRSVTSQGQPRGGLLSRMRRTLFGDETLGSKLKRGLFGSKAGTTGGIVEGAAGNAVEGTTKVVAKGIGPKKLAALVVAMCLGTFSIASIFTVYRNDGAIRNDPPLTCERGVIDFDNGGHSDDMEIQDRVNIMYDIFCNQFGYSESALVGMLACMMTESTINPDRLEGDYVLTAEKEAFDAAAGIGTVPSGDDAKNLYWTYGEAFQSSGIWNGNDFYIDDEGHMCCGVGLIQWTRGRALELFEGLDRVGMDVSPMDLSYQCAFLLYEAKTKPSYARCSPEDGELVDVQDDVLATEIFFTTMVSGGSSADLDIRVNNIPACRAYVDSAAANSEFTQDTVTMAELLADDSFTSAVSKSNKIQLCVNDTYISTVDIASAAVSISWLDRGEYEDVHGAYGMYRRSARSPVIVNDWDYIEGLDGGMGSGDPMDHNSPGTYGSLGKVPMNDVRYNQRYYVNNAGTGYGKLDLVACTEYYYFAHLIAYPMETGKNGHAGYFSSCDRGTATAVRIAGADDNFPAGNPNWQLAYAVSASVAGAQHDPDSRNSLWKYAGFLRGCDYYPASASTTIAAGTVMISWNVKAANGMLLQALADGFPTAGSVELGGATEEEAAAEPDDTPIDDTLDVTSAMAEANLRWPMSQASTPRHIMTYVGEGTVKKFWGMDFLFQQWQMFDDTDSLIRGDLTIEAPEEMKKGLSMHSKTGDKSSDQKATFWQQEMLGAQTLGDVQGSGASNRQMSFNAKTGLPSFRAWEQIFVRLIHNSDDDAAASAAGGADLFTHFSTDSDNYLDGETDQIEQFQGQDTYGDKWFFEDWNSVGAGTVQGGGAGDYDGVSGGELPYYDHGEDEWTAYDAGTSGSENPYWRYELITDIEYRCNQVMRFGMASFMCSLASEEDADIYQNLNGHITGNLYRRYSRIPDDVDVSGRYYFYNNVISNDMLQDLTQIWSHERNGAGGPERNFGPMYLFKRVGAGMGVYENKMQSQTYGWLDRRYGLTSADMGSIAGGIGGASMGSGAEGANAALDQATSGMMYTMSDAQLALYAREWSASSKTDGRGAHESTHEYVGGGGGEIYGINPFLSLEANLGRVNGEYLNLNPGLTDWRVTAKSASARKTVDMTVAEAVDPASSLQDDRLSWIERHYTAGYGGNINMIAYQVTSLNPSLGRIAQADEYAGAMSGYSLGYVTALKNAKTLNATETHGEGANLGVANADKLYGSWGLIRYTDFVYGESIADNQHMGRRLYKQDDRNGDGVRDDYNRREYLVIPYYHTHSQMCDHSHLEGYAHYHLACDWWGNNIYCPNPDTHMIDTQVWLCDLGEGAHLGIDHQEVFDSGDTISFDGHISNRGKYDLTQLFSKGNVSYYTNNGNKILVTERPRIHVTCPGTWVGATHYTCAECVERNICHLHYECDGGIKNPDGEWCIARVCHLIAFPFHHQDGGLTRYVSSSDPRPRYYYMNTNIDESDDCHEHYGCNALEFLYHNPGERRRNGEVVTSLYMVIQVVDNPKEPFDISKWMVNGQVVPDKANLIQQVYYDHGSGYVDYDWEALTNGEPGSLTNPDYSRYYNSIHYLSSVYPSGAYSWTFDSGVTMPIGNNGKTVTTVGYGTQNIMFGGKSLFGIFTVEGDIVRCASGAGSSGETISDPSENCTLGDFEALQPLRNRMGAGKSITQPVCGVGITIAQGGGGVYFDSSSHGEPGITAGYGYGEVAVTGTQHGRDPTATAGGYGENEVCGPDGSTGNKKSAFGNSLLREILGDEHVFHIRFGSQNPAGLTNDDDNGRDFNYYTEFVDVDDDFKYLDPTTGLPTDKRYYDSLKRKCTDSPTNELGQANLENRALVGSASSIESDTYIANCVDGGCPDGATNHGGGNGDYGQWITHSGRGVRGMNTQYIGFKGFYGDAFDDSGSTSKVSMYMLFTNIKRKDDSDVDGDGNRKEDFIYPNAPAGAVDLDPSRVWGTGSVAIKNDAGDIIGYEPENFSDCYGQGSNSHWKNLIDIYNAAMSETRHFD